MAGYTPLSLREQDKLLQKAAGHDAVMLQAEEAS